MKKIIRNIDISINRAENFLIISITVVMVVMAFLQVVLRNFFSMGLLWGDIFLRHLVLWIGFLGASLATRDNKHIRIDILSRVTPKQYLPYLNIVIDYMTMIVCFVLANAGYRFLYFEIEANTILFNTTLFNDIPAWIFQMIIPIGFDLIAFRFFIKLIQQFIEIFEKQAAVAGTFEFNWGAFSLSGIWLVFYRRFVMAAIFLLLQAALFYYWKMLFPAVNFIMALTIVLIAFYWGIQGNNIVQQTKKYDTFDALKNGQRSWNIAGVFIACLMSCGLIIYRFFFVISTEL